MTPRLSVVLPVPLRYALVRRTIRHLRAQTVRHELELLLVKPAGASADVDHDELRDFASARVIELDERATLTQCRVAGARAATAPVVAFAEDHSFPSPEWAESMLRAHDAGFDAVAPSFHNGNPRTAVSWADIHLAFGTWVAPLEGGEMPGLPWHNTTYKRDLLLSFGERLPEVLEVETVLQEALRARGHRLYLDPTVHTAHVNFSRIGPFVVEYLVSGRLFGGRRAQALRWSPLRRVVYIAGSPLIPLIRLPQVIRQMRRGGRGHVITRALPALLLGLTAHTLGEAFGYAFGAGNAGEQKSAREFDRARFVVSGDLECLAP